MAEQSGYLRRWYAVEAVAQRNCVPQGKIGGNNELRAFQRLEERIVNPMRRFILQVDGDVVKRYKPPELVCQYTEQFFGVAIFAKRPRDS